MRCQTLSSRFWAPLSILWLLLIATGIAATQEKLFTAFPESSPTLPETCTAPPFTVATSLWALSIS